jgi:SAM-dependent methyltransferase
MKATNEAEERRAQVAEAYTNAVRQPSGCCGSGPSRTCTGGPGYETTEVEGLPEDAVTHAFGCGNPVGFAALREGDVVLDLGSGAGIDLLLAARRVGPEGRVIGVDMTAEMVSRARGNLAEAGADNVEVREGIIEALPVDDASVDWVVSNCVINLSPEKPRVFSEIARVLRPGGRLLVADIVTGGPLPPSMKEDPELYAGCVGGAIPETEYLDGLRAAGLEDVEVRTRSESQFEGRIWSAIIAARKPDRG